MNVNFFYLVASWILVLASNLDAQVDLAVTGVPRDAPFTVKATATATDLIVDFALQPEWHVYSRDVGGGEPVTLTVDSRSTIVATGELQLPPSDSGELTGDVQIRLPIGVGKQGPTKQLDATMQVQVCDALECLPPMEVTIQGEIPALQVLLVVGAEDERAGRIEKWLKLQGFESTTQTYVQVEASHCDAHDVVLADSKVFRQTDAKRSDVHAFPDSETPLIAVGFNGTELIESKSIAMTSGYI